MDQEASPYPTSGQFRAARALLGLSQVELAAISGTSRRTIVSLETSPTMVANETVRAIVSALEKQGIYMLRHDEVVGVKRIGRRTTTSRPNLD